MSIKESVRLVIDSANLAKGGEVFITKMPVIRISDLAEAMINALAPLINYHPSEIEIKVVGVKPGEKLYEELMSSEKKQDGAKLSQYFTVLPAFRDIYQVELYMITPI